MAQTRYFNYKENDSTDLLNRKDLSALPHGVWRGFDYSIFSIGTDLILNHDLTGYVETDISLSVSALKGAIKTKQGVIIMEDAAITITVAGNGVGANPRIDLIICEHEYVATPGGAAATYSQIAGTVSATPVPPALTSPEKQVIMGYLYWPTGAANITSAIYLKAPVPEAPGVRKMTGQLNLTKGVAQVTVGQGRIELDGGGNYYEASFSFTGIAGTGLQSITSFGYMGSLFTKAGALIYLKVSDNVASGLALLLNDNTVRPNYSGFAVDRYVASGDILTLIENDLGKYEVINVFPGTGQVFTVGTSPGPNYGTNWASSTIPVTFRRDAKDRMWFSGNAVRSSGSATNVFTLPVGFRPLAIKTFVIPWNAGGAGSYATASLIINTDGTVVIAGAANTDIYYFDSVSFQIG